MKRNALLCLGLLLAATTALTAQNMKVATVSLEALYSGFYKTQEGQTKIERAGQIAQEEAKQYQAEGEKLVEEFRATQEELENPALNDEAKDQLEVKAQAQLQVIQEKERDLREWQQRTAERLQQQRNQLRSQIINEITKAAVAVAEREGYNYLFNTSDATGAGVPAVLLAPDETDITDLVLTELNKDAPQD